MGRPRIVAKDSSSGLPVWKWKSAVRVADDFPVLALHLLAERDRVDGKIVFHRSSSKAQGCSAFLDFFVHDACVMITPSIRVLLLVAARLHAAAIRSLTRWPARTGVQTVLHRQISEFPLLIRTDAIFWLPALKGSTSGGMNSIADAKYPRLPAGPAELAPAARAESGSAAPGEL